MVSVESQEACAGPVLLQCIKSYFNFTAIVIVNSLIARALGCQVCHWSFTTLANYK